MILVWPGNKSKYMLAKILFLFICKWSVINMKFSIYKFRLTKLNDRLKELAIINGN